MNNMIGNRIKERRKALKLTGAQIKDATGISTGNLSEIETGKSLPSATSVIQLAKVLNCTTDYILLGDIPKSEIVDSSDLRDDELLLLKQFQALDCTDREEILMLVQMKYNRHLKKTESSHSEDNNILTETA